MLQKIYTDFMVAKQALIGLMLIGLMFVSTIAFSFIQAPSFLTQNQQQETPSLPAGKIITSPLTARQEAFMLQSHLTIMTLKYNLNCTGCLDAKNLAEAFTLNSEFSDQLYLVELEDSSLAAPLLGMRSAFGARDLSSNITQESIRDALCSVVAKPPFSCIGVS
jgi:hypothetical protein